MADPDIAIVGRSKKSFTKLIQSLPKQYQKEAQALLQSILFKDEQTFLRNTDSGENVYTGKDGNFWGVDESSGTSVLINNTGTNFKLDTTNFDNILSTADTNVQLAMDTIDDHTIDDHPIPFGTSLVGTTTLAAATRFVRCNGTFTVNLPAADDAFGLPITIKNVGTGTITIDGAGSETIDGALTFILDKQYQAVTIISDDGNWQIQTDHKHKEFPELEVGDSSNYMDVSSTGYVTLVGTATAWEDLRVPVSSVVAGGAAPTWAQVKDNGSGSTGVFAYHFPANADKEVHFSVQMPHQWKKGSNIWPHVHWCPEADETGDPEPTVAWGIEYTWANKGSVFGNTTLVAANVTDGPFTAFTHTITGLGEIDSTGKENSSVLLCRVFRDVSEDTYTQDAIMLSIDLHYEVESFGSDTNPSNP